MDRYKDQCISYQIDHFLVKPSKYTNPINNKKQFLNFTIYCFPCDLFTLVTFTSNDSKVIESFILKEIKLIGGVFQKLREPN